MSDNFNTIVQRVETLKEEYSKFSEKGVKASGTRARKVAKEIADAAKELRKEIQESKNSE